VYTAHVVVVIIATRNTEYDALYRQTVRLHRTSNHSKTIHSHNDWRLLKNCHSGPI
jgi:hypothetical protein